MAKSILIREDLTYTDLMNNAKDAKVKDTMKELADAGLSAYIMSDARYKMYRPHPYAPIEDYKANPVKNFYDLLKHGTDAIIEYLDGGMLFVKETVVNPTEKDKTICTDSVPFLVSYTFNSLYKRLNAAAREVLKPIADSKNQALKDKFIRYIPSLTMAHSSNRLTLDKINNAVIRGQQGIYYYMGIDK